MPSLLATTRFEYPVENEVLLHLAHALVQEEVAFLPVDDDEMRLQLGAILFVQALQNHVLLELQADHVLAARFPSHVMAVSIFPES